LYSRLSRLLDISVSFIGCLLLIAVIPLVFIGNFFGNRGPLFFSQPRVGKGLKNFDILKFRSMVVGTGASSWTTDDDPRITTFGRWLRKSHLDEVPQFWNILRGDLSIVGPRPEQPHYVEQLNEQIPFYRMRHIVRPGLTGWAQVNYPYGSNATDAYEKLQYEFWYLRHQGLGLDMKILARTLRHVIGFRGR
jgi:lipopolysaccharide/colanic/teichoic acid biosynthesis glycosyltransferase